MQPTQCELWPGKGRIAVLIHSIDLADTSELFTGDVRGTIRHILDQMKRVPAGTPDTQLTLINQQGAVSVCAERLRIAVSGL